MIGSIASRIPNVSAMLESKFAQVESKTGVRFRDVLSAVTNDVASESEIGINEESIRQELDLTSLFADNYGIYNSLNRVYGSAENESSASKYTKYDSIISEAANKYNISEALIKAVINQESGFNKDATSWAGAQGLMQLMPATARGLGVTDSYDPVQNILGGVKYLRGQLDRFDGNVMLALAAYNAGPGRVASAGVTNLNSPDQMAKLPSETQNYVRSIMSALSA